MSYVTGKIIKELREKKKLTQKQLGDILQVSDKTISKWETDRGLPDIGLISHLAEALGVSVAELLMGEYTENGNISGNMKKIVFYVCPICGNVIQAIGRGSYSCCGIMLPTAEIEESDELHEIKVEEIDHEYFLHMRGVLCNILVCLAVWCGTKLKSESAKLIMIFWCLFAFITSGFEHSIANMTLLTVSLLAPFEKAVSLSGYFYNLSIVTLGNMVGGIVFVAVPYYLASKKKEV